MSIRLMDPKSHRCGRVLEELVRDFLLLTLKKTNGKRNMNIPYYHVDAFADRGLSGNPAGVCLLADWLPDDALQSIAAENNHAETAFVVQRQSTFDLRWFTPAIEMDLCGNATLA